MPVRMTKDAAAFRGCPLRRTISSSFLFLCAALAASLAAPDARADDAAAPGEPGQAPRASATAAARPTGDEPATSQGPATSDASAEPAKSQAPATSEDRPARDADDLTVKLHVESPSVVAIERVDTGELVCTSPCDVSVSAAVAYRVAGSRPSKAFYLDASRKTDLTVTVRPASKRGSVIGWTLLGGGIAALGAGVATLAVGQADRGPMPDDGVTHNGFTDAMIIGTALTLAGTALGIAGGSIVLGNRETKVRGNVAPARPSKGLAPQPTIKAAAPSAPALFVPILGGTF